MCYLTLDCNVCVEVDRSINQIVLNSPENESDVRQFTYDSVYGIDSTQKAIYDETAFPLVESVLNGYNGTIFAYGQTGCGKTHTMMGLPDDLNKGIIPKAFDHVFGCIDDVANSSKKFLVRASFIEIY